MRSRGRFADRRLWDALVDVYSALVRPGEYIDNGTLRQHYTRCAILLNDHWASMRENGFISNRICDAAGVAHSS